MDGGADECFRMALSVLITPSNSAQLEYLLTAILSFAHSKLFLTQ